MTTTIQTTTNGTNVILEGCLDTAASKKFEEAIQPLMNLQNTQIVIDCTKLEYISSSGLRLFIILMKASKSNASSLTLRHLSEAVMEVFKMTGFVNIFHID